MESREPSESREERLTRIAQRLEAKIRVIWEEKNALTERLELATLDKELAEERYFAMEASLRSESEQRTALEARIAELEELRTVSTELEESYLAEKHELSMLLEELKKELEAANQKIAADAEAAQNRINELLASQTSEQSMETLRQELQLSKLQLSACRLDLEVERIGMANALKQMFVKNAPEYLDLLPFIEFYKLSGVLREPYSEFRDGDISTRNFAHIVAQEVKNAEAKQSFAEPDWPAIIQLLRLLEHSSSPHLHTVLARLLDAQPNLAGTNGEINAVLRELMLNVNSTLIESLELEVQKIQTQQAETDVLAEAAPKQEPSEMAAQEVETLKLRIRFLESKLSQAQELAAEIDSLKAWQAQARSREAQLEKLLVDAEHISKTKDLEITKLKRAELPTTLDAALVQQKLNYMSTALKWFSRSNHRRLALEPLRLSPPCKVSLLTGNSHVSALRKAVLNFNLVDAAVDGKWRPRNRNPALVALDQFEKLIILGVHE